MRIDAADLLKPVSDQEPAGPEPPFDPQRFMIEQSFDRPFAISAKGAEKPEEKDGAAWEPVVEAIVDQFGKTKDIWLAVYLMRAGARWGRLEVVEAGALALAGLLDGYWDSMHPPLADGAVSRSIACASLSSHVEFLAPLGALVLVSHPRFGAFNCEDLRRFHANGESEPNYGFFRHALADLAPDVLKGVDERLQRTTAAFQRADTLFREKAGGEAPSFSAAIGRFAEMRSALRPYINDNDGEPGAIISGDDDAISIAHSPTGRGSDTSAPGRTSTDISSRDDVVKALDAIIAYYRRREPSSPVPLALERTRAWVTMPFMDLLMDIAPASREELKRVLFAQKDGT